MRNKTKHVLKRALAVIMSMAVILAAIPCYPVHAETAPGVYITSGSVTAGNSTTLYVKASDFESVAGLEMAVHYDEEAFSVTNAWATGLSSGQVNDINRSVPGTVKYSMISVDGVSGSGNLIGITFKSSPEAITAGYPITVTVSDTYDVNFNNLTIGKTSGTLTVKEKTQTVENISFYSQLNKNLVETGEEFTYSLKSGNIGDLSGGNFEFTYDADALDLVNVDLTEVLTSKTAVQSINTKTPGYIKVSYAAIEAIGVNWSKLIDITFKAKDKAYDETNIVFSTTELIGEDLAAMSASKLTDTVKITKPQTVIDNPDFILSWDGTMTSDRTVDVVAKLPADTSVAAGDFVITYDTAKLKCTSAKADSAISSNGGYLVTKEDIGNGQVKFSYVTTNPSNKETALLHMTFEAVDQFLGETTLAVKGTGVVNLDHEDVNLDYPSKNITIEKYDISKMNIDGVSDSYIFTGIEIMPEVIVGRLSPNNDYIVTYTNNINVGEAEIIITGIGDYKGKIIKKFLIVPIDISGFSYNGIEDTYSCTAEAIEPIVKIEGLEEEQDYKASYKNNIYAGIATVTIEGINNYTGTITKDFRIEHIFSNYWITDEQNHWHECVCGVKSDEENHIEEVVPGIAATCEEIGLTEGKKCSVCGKITVAQEEVPSIKHAYGEVEYTWSEDNKAVTAKRTCANDVNHIEEETVESTYEVVTAATCTAVGEGRFTAAFTNEAFGTKIKTVDIPKLKHTYSDVEYTWSEDNKFLTAKRVCVNDVNHVEEETVESTYEIIKDATCTAKGVGKFTALFTNEAFVTKEKIVDIPKLMHTEEIDEAAEPTCTETGLTEGLHCSVCGTILIAQETIPALGHNFSDWNITKNPTYTEKGHKSRGCSRCDYIENEDIDKLVIGTLKLDKSTATIMPDKTLQLKLTVTPEAPIAGEVKWISSNESVATVDQSGKAVALKEGTVTITAILADKEVSCIVTVKLGTWKKSGTKYWYQYTDGTYPKSCWVTIGGKDYYFDKSGYMAASKWVGDYYVDSSGAKQKNKAVGAYYVGEDGKYIKNQWVGTKYYGKSGAYTKGWLKLDEGWYYFNSSGVVKKGWFQVGETWYYGDKSTGLLYEGEWLDSTYYFKSGGAMATGWLKMDESWYYFASSGAVKKDWFKVGKTWYYGDLETGILYEDKWLDDTYYFKTGGAMVTGWLQIDGKYYYFNTSGAKVTNKWVGNYYLKSDGVMATDEWIGNYYVDKNGKWVKGA